MMLIKSWPQQKPTNKHLSVATKSLLLSRGFKMGVIVVVSKITCVARQ